jgi:hypothetical protein
MAENAGSGKLRTHSVGSVMRPTVRLERVSLPLVRSRQPGRAVLDNAKIFEIIPFP